MKVLSIKQPWAWAICSLPNKYKKDIENRTWKTKYRGHFLIHAGKSFDKDGYNRFKFHLAKLGYNGEIPLPNEFESGCVIGVSEIYDTTDKAVSEWFEGPIGFKLRNSKQLKDTIPLKGQLQFFNSTLETLTFLLNCCIQTCSARSCFKLFKVSL